MQSSRAWIAILVILNIVKWNEMKEKEAYQPPGAAQRSMRARADERKSCFLLSWTNLKAARERKPWSFAR